MQARGVSELSLPQGGAIDVSRGSNLSSIPATMTLLTLAPSFVMMNIGSNSLTLVG